MNTGKPKSTTRRPTAAQPATNEPKDYTQAAMFLATARTLWLSPQYRRLVEADTMPEPYLSAYIAEFGTSPETAAPAEYHFA